MREKLIGILRVPIYPHELADPTEVVADYLLDNDVVPVVRCKDCKHYVLQACACRHDNFNGVIPMNGFCSYGERRTDERKAD